MFARLDGIDDIWKELVKKWVKLEIRDGYGGTKRLGATGRPECVKHWIQCARPSKPNITAYPKLIITDFEAYAKEFWGWWGSLQPDFRQANKTLEGVLAVEAPANDSSNAWGHIDISGINGLVSVLAALYFWGAPIDQQPSRNYREKQIKNRNVVKWVEAAKDVGFVFDRILNNQK